MNGHFVTVPAGLGRKWFMMIALWAEQSGCGVVEHFAGGWMDDVTKFVEPHLSFDSEEDALAYVLMFGGQYNKTPPIQVR